MSTVHSPQSTQAVSGRRGPWTEDYGPASLGWRVLIEAHLSGEAQMARDVELARETLPTVRFFRWDPPAVSRGLRQAPPAWLSAAGLQLVERPTGGGVAFHGSDVSIAVIVPRSLDLPLALLMEAVCDNAAAMCRHVGAPARVLLDAPAGRRITYCLAETSPYAVMSEGRKVAGFALRRFPQTWLIQGSLLVRPLPEVLASAMPSSVAERLKARAVSLSEAVAASMDETAVADQWARCWAGWWEETLLGALRRKAG